MLDFRTNPPVSDVLVRLILYEPYEGLKQERTTDSQGKVVFDLSNEREGTYQLDISKSGYRKPDSVFFNFRQCRNTRLTISAERDNALAALLDAQSAITSAESENKNITNAQARLREAYAAYYAEDYGSARELALDAARLAVYGEPLEVMLKEMVILIANDTITEREANETADETALHNDSENFAMGADALEKEPEAVLAMYTVTTRVYENATFLSLVFVPENEFEGTLRAGLETDFEYYRDGTINVNSSTHGSPTQVVKGSILAYWDGISLMRNEEFRAEFSSSRRLSSEEILSARIDFVGKQDIQAARPATQNASQETKGTTDGAGLDSYALPATIFVILVLVAAIVYVAVRRKKED